MASRPEGSHTAFFRFHLRVGVRIGLRLLAPILAGLFAAYYLLRPELILLLLDHLLKRGGAFGRGLSLAVVNGLIGAVIAPRVTLGLGGWIRHLPAASRSQRGMAAVSILIAEIPILLPLAAAALLLPDKNSPAQVWASVAGLFASAFFMALYLLPVRQPLWASGLTLAACILAGSGRPLLMAAAAAAAFLADRATGPFLGRGRPKRRLIRPSSEPAFFGFLLNLRAAGFSILWSLLPPALFFGWLVVFLANNPLAPGPIRAAVRLAAGGAAAGALAAAAASLGKHRPVWPWSRSLPIGSRKRVLQDALFLAVPGAAALAAFALYSPAALPAAGLLPYAAFRAAAAARPSMETPRSPIPGLVLELLLAAIMTALIPAAAGLLAVLAVPAWSIAARRERSLKTGLWLERRYSADGDSLTWSSR
ncbi:MAG: hypothetical protein PHI34_00080 [Acidobacteriota bacterium]|nr:hypothetical protein [Acidobacteriota bacterium]